ncbi:helix-turn-helix transcriptional regulator [Brachybacterium saurashtrense]|uniref:Transcriptional regulator n=1 Tax=Brachybacterium saurashtrense TaxID=556288 RepID=A0A345YJU0_9MICO|nr:PAS domain-containing protein [Brachybacterium saurashtrense]AXK44192.1 transcriptional regulator [Brachybacterium saurashtrense]RRR21464.1 transcriptional regulator [Brachybacterium saurashtrense]
MTETPAPPAPLPVDGRTRFADIAEAEATLAPVMEAIAAVGGAHCEVVLHDLSAGDLDHSVRAILNGHVSGRSVGGPSTNLGVEVLRDQEKDHDAFGYRGRTADGRELISSSVYFRDHDGQVIAALCINRDLSPLQDVMTALTALAPEAGGTGPAEPPHELVAPDVTSVLEDMITEAIAATGKPPAAMTKADRIEVLRLLEDRGAFHIKRAAEKVSARLGVSRVTAYGYLDEVRRG